MNFHRLLPVIALCLIAGAVQAAVTLEGFDAGTHVHGPKYAAADLKGRVVLVEYWGVNCPPCLASIPHLSALQEKYGRDQFVIVANQCQGANEAQAQSTFKARGGSDQITVINHGELKGANVSGIPHCFLFSHEGKLVYEGSPFNLDAPVETAVKASPGFLVAGRAYQKTAKQAAAIGALKGNLTGTLKSLRTLAKGEDAVAKEEAEHLLGRLGDYSERSMATITTARTEDPVLASETLGRMVALFAGDDLGKPFESLVKELKTDKAFQAELKAMGVLSEVRAQASKIGLDTNPEDAKRNRQGVAQVAEGLRALVKRFPDTRAAGQAPDLAKRWGL